MSKAVEICGLTPDEVLKFWFQEAGPERWYTKSDEFDQQIIDRFQDLVLALAEMIDAQGVCDWQTEPKGALATVITLDQFPRNIYRGSPLSFSFDGRALGAAKMSIEKHWDTEMPVPPRGFFYLPFMHSEELADQQRCVDLITKNNPEPQSIRFAQEHLDIIKRFGRFPHRNVLLARETTPEEQLFLDEGGFAG